MELDAGSCDNRSAFASLATVAGWIVINSKSPSTTLRIALNTYAKPNLLVQAAAPMLAVRSPANVLLPYVTGSLLVSKTIEAIIDIPRQDSFSLIAIDTFLLTESIPNNADVLLGKIVVYRLGLTLNDDGLCLRQAGD